MSVLITESLDWQALNCECLAKEEEPEDAPAAAPAAQAPDPEQVREVDQALKRLHPNLGHPSQRQLLRVLRHSRASQAAEFNERVGLDIKYLPGWLPGQKVAAVNIVDYASSLKW